MGAEHKLAAILSADVVGYSRLMAEDEAATIRTLSDYREAVAMLVRQYRGRVVDTPGDNPSGWTRRRKRPKRSGVCSRSARFRAWSL